MSNQSERRAISCGIAASVLLTVGLLTAFGALPMYDPKDPIDTINAELVKGYDDSGKRITIIVGAYLIVISSAALICFVSGLRTRIRRVSDGTVAGDIVFAAGIVAATMLAAGGLCVATIAGDRSIGNDPAFTSGELLRALPALGYPLILIGGMLMLAVVIGAVSALSVRGGLVPRWLSIYGWIALLGALLAPLFIPMILVALWLLLVGIVAATGKLTEPAIPVGAHEQ